MGGWSCADFWSASLSGGKKFGFSGDARRRFSGDEFSEESFLVTNGEGPVRDVARRQLRG